MTLQLGINVSLAENVDQPLRRSLRMLCTLHDSVVKRARERTIFCASQTDQTFRVRRQFLKRGGALSRLCMLRHTQLHQRDQATEILIAEAIAYEERD
jgi:hypothetical protein